MLSSIKKSNVHIDQYIRHKVNPMSDLPSNGWGIDSIHFMQTIHCYKKEMLSEFHQCNSHIDQH